MLHCCLNHRHLLDGEYKQLRDDLNIMRTEVLTHGNGGVNIPVNLRRLIWNAQVRVLRDHMCQPSQVTALSPGRVVVHAACRPAVWHLRLWRTGPGAFWRI